MKAFEMSNDYGILKLVTMVHICKEQQSIFACIEQSETVFIVI